MLLRRPDVRLLTLTGAGGSGKTRLALALAASLRGAFPDGVFLVELAPIREPGLVLVTIAAAFGLTDAGTPPVLERLIAYLRERRLLLLLDNFEHVAEAAPLLATLLSACPSLTLLATSRAPLHLRGEREVEVPPLAVPDLQRPTSLDPTVQTAAVRLFVARVQDVRPDFRLTPENTASVNEICVRLDGLPLAIELAAARIKVLPPEALLARLGHRLQLLTSGARDLPARQQTLRNTIDWSYHLLNESEQRLFRRLGVFVGGWTLVAAESVCDSTGDLGIELLDGMQALVDQSLVRQEHGLDGEPRFVMLETIREYALEQLAVRGELEARRSRHVAFFVVLAERAQLHVRGPQHGIWLARLDVEHPNLREALAWAQTAPDGDTELRLAVALSEYWARRGYLSEGRTYLTHAAARAADGSGNPRVEAHHILRAQVLDMLGVFAAWQGDLEAAQSALDSSLALFREHEHRAGIVAALSHLGMLCEQRGDQERAGALLEQSLVLAREIGETHRVSWNLAFLGIPCYRQGNLPRAKELWAESLSGFRAREEHWGIAAVLSYLGMVAIDEGDYAQSSALLTESLTGSWESGDRWQIAFALELCACLTAAVGHRQEDRRPYGRLAAELFGTAEVLRELLGSPPMLFQRVSYQRGLDTARTYLDEAAFAAAWKVGRSMPLEQAIAEALEGLHDKGTPVRSEPLPGARTGRH